MNLHWIHKVMEGCSKGEGNRGLEAQGSLGDPSPGSLYNCSSSPLNSSGQAPSCPVCIHSLNPYNVGTFCTIFSEFCWWYLDGPDCPGLVLMTRLPPQDSHLSFCCGRRHSHPSLACPPFLGFYPLALAFICSFSLSPFPVFEPSLCSLCPKAGVSPQPRQPPLPDAFYSICVINFHEVPDPNLL